MMGWKQCFHTVNSVFEGLYLWLVLPIEPLRGLGKPRYRAKDLRAMGRTSKSVTQSARVPGAAPRVQILSLRVCRHVGLGASGGCYWDRNGAEPVCWDSPELLTQAGPSFVFADTCKVTPSLSSFQEQPVLHHLSLNALAGVASLAGAPEARAQELDSRSESCLCSKQLCGFAQVTSTRCLSVFICKVESVTRPITQCCRKDWACGWSEALCLTHDEHSRKVSFMLLIG